MEHRLSDILQFAPKNLQLYYKSSKLEQTVYFDEVYEHSNGKKYIIVNKEKLEINEDSDTEFIESSKLMILDSRLIKSNLFPFEEYLSWVNWQYILFPKSVGSVICGLDDKYFYIINETEMIDENGIIYNMCNDLLPIFSYADINKTKFKDMDCSELISKRDDLFNETLINAINDVTQKAELENTDKSEPEFLNNTDGFVFIASDWIEMIKDCKSKEEVIRAFSDKYGSDYVKKIEKFIPD